MWLLWMEYRKILSLLLILVLGGGSVAGYRMMSQPDSGSDGLVAVNAQMDALLDGKQEKQPAAEAETAKPAPTSGGTASAAAAPEDSAKADPPSGITAAPAPQAKEGSSSQAPRTEGAAKPGTVNLNTASLSKLMDLPGIGESKAKAIMAYREKNGGFRTIEEIMNVKGIGQKTFDSIKERITVSP